MQQDLTQILASIHTESGATLLALTEQSPVLLVFLRHFGCSFCRQAISDVADLKSELAAKNVRPVFIHLGTPERAAPFFAYYGIPDVERISDPEASLYRSFDLARQNPFTHFFIPKVVLSWLTGSVKKYGIGKIQEDAHQMPGIFFLKEGRIVRSFRYKTIADQPNYRKLIA